MPILNTAARRLGDGFALGITRFASSDKRAIWMLSASHHPNSPPVLEMVATEQAMTDLRDFANDALRQFRTDGGRTEGETPARDAGS